MSVCPNCGDSKFNLDDKCCLSCGMLNQKSKSAQKYLKENLDYYIDGKKSIKRDKVLFKISFILDILIYLLFLKLFSITSVLGIIISFILLFYRITVIKILLYKSSLMWKFVYMPVLGILMLFELGFIKAGTYTKSAWMLVIAPYLLFVFCIALAFIGDINNVITFLIIVIVIYSLSHIVKTHIKVCNGICYRFAKDKKFKKKLIFLFPIYILKLAFGKDSGNVNFEETEID